MLGSNCNTPADFNTRSCVEIRDWNSSPQSKGCLKYQGKYYVNLVTGNTTKPDEGLAAGTYAVGSTEYCDIVKYFATNQTTCDMSSTFMKFFTGIGEYSNCENDKVFDCGEFIIYKNQDDKYELHQSLESNNSRHPHDRSVWKNLGDFTNILSLIFDEADGYQLTLPYWVECTGANCASLYDKCNLVVEKIESGRFDDCGNPIYDELIFESLVDKNTDKPSLGAAKAEPTWSGPHNDVEFLNRKVGNTVNDEVIKLGRDVKFVTMGDFCDGFEWIDVDTGECEEDCDPVLVKKLCAKPIGTDENDNDIAIGGDGCYLSCESVDNNDFSWGTDEDGNKKLRVNFPAPTEVETCDLSALVPKHIVPNANGSGDVKENHTWLGSAAITSGLAGLGIATDNTFVTFKTVTFTKADLIAMGMRTTDNSVFIELRAEVRLVEDTGGNTGTENQQMQLATVANQCDGNFTLVASSGDVQIEPGDSNENQIANRSNSGWIPLNADGSITVNLMGGGNFADPITADGLELRQRITLHQFARMENGCYQADTLTCFGIENPN